MTTTDIAAVLTSQLIASPKGVNSVFEMPNSDILAVSDDNLLEYFQKQQNGSFEPFSKIKLDKTPHTIAFDDKRGHVYVGCAWGEVDQFLVENGQFQITNSFSWSKREIAHCVYKFESETLFCAGFDGHLTVFDCVAQKVLHEVELCDKPIRYIEYDDVGGKLYLGTHGKGIPVFDFKDPRGAPPEYVFTMGDPDFVTMGHSDPVRCIFFDYKSRYMFSCDHSGRVLVWHAGIAGQEANSNALGELKADSEKLRAVCWVPEKRVLFQASESGYVTAFNPGIKKNLGEFEAHNNELMGCFVMKNGDLCTFGKDGRVCVWSIHYKEE